MLIAIAIVVILLVAALTIFVTASRRRVTTGTLSRETRARDQSQPAVEEQTLSASTEVEATGRSRSEETQANLGGEVATRSATGSRGCRCPARRPRSRRRRARPG